MPKPTLSPTRKGDAAKTRTCANLAPGLRELGQRVLLVDLDPQAHLTINMGVRRPDEIDKTIYNLLMDYDVQARDLIMRAELMKVDFIPANLELSAAEIQMINEMGREQILKDKLEPVQSLYDFIVIYCPPSLSLLSVNALVACDQLIIPL